MPDIVISPTQEMEDAAQTVKGMSLEESIKEFVNFLVREANVRGAVLTAQEKPVPFEIAQAEPL